MWGIKGFTLIEVFIVLAIIGVLAAIFVPMIIETKEKQQEMPTNAGEYENNTKAVAPKSTEKQKMSHTETEQVVAKEETVCKKGYIFIKTTSNGYVNLEQVINSFGGGIECN